MHKDIVEPKTVFIHGPFVPLSDEQITELENSVYNRQLNDFDRLVLQGMYQYAQRGNAYLEAGDPKAAEPFEYHSQRIHANILKAGEVPLTS